MIKLKPNTFKYWSAYIVFTVILSMYLWLVFAPHGFVTQKEELGVSVYTLIMLSIYGSTLWGTSKVIIINALDKTIISNHLFTKKSIIYNFADFDGYVDMIEKPGRGRPFKSIFLVKNERFILKISEFTYSNLDEVDDELKGLTYLGEQRYSWLTNLKIWFGRKALSDDLI